MERDRARVGTTIVCESCLVRGRRSGSRPPTSSHDVGGLRGVCGGPPTRASACGVGWGGGMDWRATGWGCRPAGPTPRPRRAAPARRPVSLRQVLSRALRHLLPIATSCSLAYVPPVWSCPRPHPPLPSCVPHVAPAPPLAVAPVRPEAATAPFGTAHLRAPPPSLPRPSSHLVTWYDIVAFIAFFIRGVKSIKSCTLVYMWSWGLISCLHGGA